MNTLGKMFRLIAVTAALFSTVAYSAPPDLILCSKPYGGGMWTMKPDGSDQTELCTFGWYGEFNVGGTRIAFSQYYKNGIWVMDADGSNLVQLTNFGIHPSWSPDGSKIVFASGDTYALNGRIWIMDADGSNLMQLTNRVADRPNYAHYSNKILFNSWGDGIWIINDDGTGETQISTSGDYAAWTPDDSKIIFRNYQIYVMDPDGADVHRVSHSRGVTPSMGVDGRIVFDSGSNSIIMLDTTTMTETIIATGFISPDWVNRETNPLTGPAFIFAGIGLIPFSEITDGYATTEPGYCLHVVNAPFGSSLNIFSNFAWLTGVGIASYEVQVAAWPDPSTPPSASDFVTVDDSWGNYLWNDATGKFEYHTISADANNRYSVPPASEFWYLHDLLYRWNSRRFVDGKYTMRILAYDEKGNIIPKVTDWKGNRLIMVIDNTRPRAKLDTLLYGGVPINACDIVTMAGDYNLDFIISAEDLAGHLYRYSLDAFWGENQHFNITHETYDTLVHGDSWTGIDKVPFSYSSWPQTCAYQFRVSAVSRTTNGYDPHIHYTPYNKHVTLVLE